MCRNLRSRFGLAEIPSFRPAGLVCLWHCSTACAVGLILRPRCGRVVRGSNPSSTHLDPHWTALFRDRAYFPGTYYSKKARGKCQNPSLSRLMALARGEGNCGAFDFCDQGSHRHSIPPSGCFCSFPSSFRRTSDRPFQTFFGRSFPFFPFFPLVFLFISVHVFLSAPPE